MDGSGDDASRLALNDAERRLDRPVPFERRTNLNKDEYYQVILDGVARYLESPFLTDLVKTLVRFTDARNVDFADAMGKNQIASKKWLIDELCRVTDGRFGQVYLLGGWYGLLAAMLLHDGRPRIDKVTSIDLDPTCEDVARSLNRAHVSEGKFEAVTADICAIDYHALRSNGAQIAEALVINTSCEHLPDFDGWYRRIPAGMLQVLQSNNLFDDPEHVNCVPDLDALVRQAPMSEILFAGELKLNRYSRFMLIGRK